MKKTLLILLLMATARAHESPVAAPTAAPVSRLTEAEQKKIFEEAEAAYYKEKNYARALELFHRLAAVGHAQAMESIGRMYRQGDGVAMDYASAKRWFEKQAAAGDRSGYWRIGWLYTLGGPGLEQNYASAKRWYEKQAAAGDSNGYGWIGYLYKKGGPGLKQDLEQACRYYQKAGFDWQTAAERTCSR